MASMKNATFCIVGSLWLLHSFFVLCSNVEEENQIAHFLGRHTNSSQWEGDDGRIIPRTRIAKEEARERERSLRRLINRLQPPITGKQKRERPKSVTYPKHND